jgi:hypothetical protein
VQALRYKSIRQRKSDRREDRLQDDDELEFGLEDEKFAAEFVQEEAPVDEEGVEEEEVCLVNDAHAATKSH